MNRYQMASFDPYQYHLAEKHLEKMARKGWMLEKIGTFFWKYHPCEPSSIRFSIVYSPEADGRHPNPAGELEKLQNHAREMGWEYVSPWNGMQVFCTQNPDAVSLQSDEKIRKDTFAKSLKENAIIWLILPVLWLILLGTWILRIMDDPAWMLSRNGLLGFLLAWSGLVLWGFIQGFDYLIYSRKVLKNGENGILPNSVLPRVRNWVFLVLCGMLLCLLGQFAFPGMGWWRSLGLIAVPIGLFVAFVLAIRALLKKAGARSKGWYAAVGVCGVLLLSLLTRNLYNQFRENNPPPETPLSLTVADLTGEETEPEYTSHKTGKSAVLQMERAFQRMPGDEETASLSYLRLSSPFDSLHRYLVKEYMPEGGEYRKLEIPLPVEETYQLWLDGEAQQEYLFVQGDWTAQVRFGFPVTEKQLEIAAQLTAGGNSTRPHSPNSTAKDVLTSKTSR